MKSQVILAVLAASSLLVGCGERADSPIKTTTTSQSDPVASAPAAPSDRDSAAAPTPSTHAQTVQPVATDAPTARDTPAQQPMKDLTAAEESNSMPKPGQTNNFMTPALQGESKGTQQSDGTPPPATTPYSTPAAK